MKKLAFGAGKPCDCRENSNPWTKAKKDLKTVKKRELGENGENVGENKALISAVDRNTDRGALKHDRLGMSDDFKDIPGIYF